MLPYTSESDDNPSTPPRAYRIGQAAALLDVSVDTLRRWADAGRLQTRRTEGGQRLVEGIDLARLAEELGAEREHDRDRHVALASARNRLLGIVTRVTSDTVMAQVEMRVGPHRVVSLLTREAAEELGLAPGVVAVATVKSTNVVVELPAER
ncbi:MAG: helix-turn-helix transcriptional regulator [Actinobacteria bacterium]|nr:helix-turn-helix transcriptional regulator [Actinomycetota bacterium]MBW3642385.1 helix-turn-helix transcriptional regulator [Actinomycetota bacterium]